jgi:hypothetical protein
MQDIFFLQYFITASFWPIFMFFTFLFIVSEDAGIEPRTVAEFALRVRAAKQLATSHPPNYMAFAVRDWHISSSVLHSTVGIVSVEKIPIENIRQKGSVGVLSQKKHNIKSF